MTRQRCHSTGLLPLLLLLLLLSSVRAEFNYEVEKRVVERIDDFMNGPRIANGFVDKFRSNGGFTHDMDARDRDAYLRFTYSILQELHNFDMIYVGLEDGTFMGYGIGWGTYREPANSGYNVNDPSMQLYYQACVDRETGAETNCTMQAGDKYIQCVRNCGLMKCADDETQNCSKILAESTGLTTAEISPDPDVAHCFENPQSTKWCRQYAVVEARVDNAPSLGFVPRTYHCHDARGIFTQQPGQAIKSQELLVVGDPDIELGDCEFENGVTKVERWERGDFVYCNGEVCDNTFDGGYRSRDYDPRYRGWYMDTKRWQVPNWSPPYPFFSNLDLGITYSHPIYTQDTEGRHIFEGVLGVDYTFVDVGKFLVEGYSDSSTLVVVYEEAEPNYMVASSTGRKAALKVLASDESQPCPDDSEDASLCKVVREPMSKLSGVPLDSLLVRAYKEQRDNDYPRELLTVKRSDEDDELYIVQSSFYRPGGELEWIILVISPAGEGTADAVTKENSLFGVVCVVASMGFCFCLAFFILFYRQRHERAVILADWRFTSAFLLGCALLNLSSFTLLGENTDVLCLARMWCFHFLFALALSPLFVKVWRMWRMVGAPNRRPAIVNHTTAALLSLPIVAIQTLILIIFTFVDPPRQEEVIDIEGGIVTQHVVCSQDSNAFMIVMTTYEAGLVVTGCILAYVTRNLNSQFGEAKQLMFSMYNIAFIGIITTIIVYSMDIDATGEVVLLSIAIFWATVFSSAAFVLPKLMRVKEEKKHTSIMKKSTLGRSNGAPARNSKVRFSIDDDKSSVVSADLPNTGQSMASGISDVQSNATAKQSNMSNRDMKPAKTSSNAAAFDATPTSGEEKKCSLVLSAAESAASGSNFSDSCIKGTGWTVWEQSDPNASVGRWSIGNDEDEGDYHGDANGESKQHNEDHESTEPLSSASSSPQPEQRPSMATIEEVDNSESQRNDDRFEDDQVVSLPA